LKIEDISLVVSGGARSADKLGEKFADEYKISKIVFHADWEKHGRAAGPIRNKEIIENADVVFAFWDGFSRGTASTIQFAKEAEKKLFVCVYK
jgi:hypothetical protein